jgi:hypothetical protein
MLITPAVKIALIPEKCIVDPCNAKPQGNSSKTCRPEGGGGRLLYHSTKVASNALDDELEPGLME